MKFTLKERSQKEIDAIRSERNTLARLGGGFGDMKVCPFELVLAGGKTVEVWDLTEQDILNLVEANVKEGLKDQQRAVWTHQIIDSWKKEHGKISVDMIEGFFKLKEKYEKQKSHVSDFQGDMGSEDIAFAKRVANYLNGMTGANKEITNENLIKILKNEQQLKEKQLRKDQTA